MVPLIRVDCSVCWERYNGNEKLPTVLFPCGHTFCKSCVDNIVKCPLDRIVWTDRATNFSVLETIDPGKAIIFHRETIIEQVEKAQKWLGKEMVERLRHFGEQAIQGDYKGYFDFIFEYLRLMGGLSEIDREACVVFQKIAEDPNASAADRSKARYRLAEFYEHGRGGILKSDEQARYLYEYVAHSEHSDLWVRTWACRHLAWAHEFGELGFSKSKKKAVQYYQLIQLFNPQEDESRSIRNLQSCNIL